MKRLVKRFDNWMMDGSLSGALVFVALVSGLLCGLAVLALAVFSACQGTL